MRFCAILVAALLAGCGSGDSPTDGAPPDMLVHDLLPQDAAPPACDVFAQNGCAAGQHCTVGKINDQPQNLCWPDSTPALAEGAPCTPVSTDTVTVGDNCAVGLSCVSEVGDLRCRKLCLKHTDCKANQACVAPTGSNQTGAVPGAGAVAVAACVDDSGCDPILQTGCATQRCLLSRSDFVTRVTVCGVAVIGQGAPGSDCKSSADCAAGVRCSGLGFCRQLCYAMAMASLPPGQGGCPASFMCSPIAGTGDKFGECD